MADPSESSIKNLGVFSTLEAATEVRFFLLAASFALLIDNALLILGKPGIIQLATDKQALNDSNIALQVILIFIAFSFLTSLVLPIAAGFFDELYRITILNLFDRLEIYLNELFKVEPSFRRKHNHVSAYELLEEAHATKEKYYLDLYAEYKKQEKAERESRTKFATYSFLCLSMLAINLYLAYTGRPSASNEAAAFLGSSEYIWVALGILGLMFVGRYHTGNEISSIYCPPLYKKLREKSRH